MKYTKKIFSNPNRLQRKDDFPFSNFEEHRNIFFAEVHEASDFKGEVEKWDDENSEKIDTNNKTPEEIKAEVLKLAEQTFNHKENEMQEAAVTALKTLKNLEGIDAENPHVKAIAEKYLTKLAELKDHFNSTAEYLLNPREDAGYHIQMQKDLRPIKRRISIIEILKIQQKKINFEILI